MKTIVVTAFALALSTQAFAGPGRTGYTCDNAAKKDLAKQILAEQEKRLLGLKGVLSATITNCPHGYAGRVLGMRFPAVVMPPECGIRLTFEDEASQLRYFRGKKQGPRARLFVLGSEMIGASVVGADEEIEIEIEGYSTSTDTMDISAPVCGKIAK